MPKHFLLSLVFFAVMLQLPVLAQNENRLLNESLQKDTALQAIALYPQETRNSILLACTHPEGLLRMESMQKTASESFRKILSAYSEAEQKKLWDLARYQDLVEQLGGKNKLKKKKIEEIVSKYPENIRETAKEYGSSHYEALSKIAALNRYIQAEFEGIIKDYPGETQQAYRTVLAHPEVIELLRNNMYMTVLWGDSYKKDPALVKAKMDSLGNALAAQNAKSLQDWKEGLEKDPEAKKEFEASAKDYANSQGYTDDELIIRDTRVINIVVYPYPYWFGTPWWWDYPRWYPYPYWYDWGYYYGPHGIVYIGYPSWYFTYWYFYDPYHHYEHPHFSNYCVGHYYGHRGSYTTIHRGVSQMVTDNRGRLPEDFFSNPSERSQRLKELGKFETEYRQAQSPGKKISKEEFLKTNPEKYPLLNRSHWAAPQPAVPEGQQRQEPGQPRPEPKLGSPEPVNPKQVPPRTEPRPKMQQPKQAPPKVQPKVQPKPPARPLPAPKPQPPKQRKPPKDN